MVAVNNADRGLDGHLRHLPAGPQHAQGRLARRGASNLKTDAEGRVTVTVPPLSAVVYRANEAARHQDSPAPVFTSPGDTGIVTGRAEVGVDVPGGDFTQITFAWRPVGTQDWQVLGTDDNAPYRVFHDVRGLALGTPVEYRAIVRDHDGDVGVVSTSAVVGQPQPPADPGSTSGRSPSPTPSRCRAATAARSAARPTGTRRVTPSS